MPDDFGHLEEFLETNATPQGGKPKPSWWTTRWYKWTSWCWRSVDVWRPDPNQDVAEVLLDYGDERPRLRFYLSRNNLFSTTYIMLAFVADVEFRRRQKKMPFWQDVQDVEITFIRVPDVSGEPNDVQVIPIPTWTIRKLTAKLKRIAIEFGWQGQCPKPDPRIRWAPYR